MSQAEEEKAGTEITLSGEDCAVVFRTDGSMNVFIPSREEGSPVPPQMLYSILVQEMLKDPFMMKVLTERVINTGVLSKSSPPDEAPKEEGANA